MAKQKKKKPKISTGDAIKILANDSKLAKQHIINTQQMCRDYFSLFELKKRQYYCFPTALAC